MKTKEEIEKVISRLSKLKENGKNPAMHGVVITALNWVLGNEISEAARRFLDMEYLRDN
jgi:hypothetical protein